MRCQVETHADRSTDGCRRVLNAACTLDRRPIGDATASTLATNQTRRPTDGHVLPPTARTRLGPVRAVLAAARLRVFFAATEPPPPPTDHCRDVVWLAAWRSG